MTRLGHVILVGSLLMGPQAFAQTIAVPPPDRVTINMFTASTSSKVQDIVASTKNQTAPASGETFPVMKNLTPPLEDERKYNAAVEDVRERIIGGALSFGVGESGTRMGLGNNPNGGAALIMKGNLNMTDSTGNQKGTGTIEGGLGGNGAFVTLKIRF